MFTFTAHPRRRMADVSNNNHRPNFQTYRAAGHRAIAIKATEGVGGRQSNYPEWIDEAHHAGLHVVHYHFARPDHHRTSGAEAADFLAFIKPHVRRGDRVALDLEVEPAGGVDLARYTHDFAAGARHVLGHRHGWLYSDRDYFNRHGLGRLLPRGWRVWMADFSANGAGGWAHQYTNGVIGPGPHEAAGIGPVDMSVLTRRAYVGLMAMRRRPRGHR